MRKIMVANPKGGCGKSTLSVHIASWFARHDEIVYLGDLDRQQSSRHWLEARPENLATIKHWDISADEFKLPPKHCNVAILDTPAGLHGKRRKEVLNEVDKVDVPVPEGKVRLRDFFARFDFRYVDQRRTEVTFMTLVDPGGAVPPALAKIQTAPVPFDTLKGLGQQAGDAKYRKKAVTDYY